MDLSKIIGKSRNFIKNAISHLNLNGVSIYNKKARKEIISYSEDCIDKIKELLILVNNDSMYLNKQTNLKKYGVEYPFQNKDVQNKCIETCKKKYGVSNYNQTKESQIRKEKTCMKKYGVKNPSQNKEIRKKIINTNLKKFGVFNVSQNKDVIEKRKIKNINKLNYAKNQNLISIEELSDKFNKYDTTIIEAIKRLNIEIITFDLDKRYYIHDYDLCLLTDYFYKTEMCSSSFSEKEIVNFIKSVCDYEIIENSKKIIPPKELDIYIPKMKIAIEYDGLHWHDENHVNKNYHLLKTNLCNEKGIDLIHVFEDDWLNKKEIVKSMISSRLGIYKQKIFARKCKLKEIEKEQAKIFFNENHLQGFTYGDLYLGLFYNDELVQCICINKKGWHDGNVELTRMVTKINIQVIGGFSKLMKHISNYIEYKSITSYVYKAWFNGKGYLKSGFKIIDENPPSYSYIINDKRIHKSHFRKDKIKKMYENKQLNYYDENKTEHELMMKNNIYRIYDCGTIKVVYNRK